jgi:hypothetical protein
MTEDAVSLRYETRVCATLHAPHTRTVTQCGKPTYPAVGSGPTSISVVAKMIEPNMITNPYASLCRKCPPLYIPGHHPIKPTPICESAPLGQHTNTTFQTLLGNADHCHMEHQGQVLPQCSQQRLAKRTCQKIP